MNKCVKVADRFISKNHPPLVIAELSGNHNQSLDLALKMVNAAAKSGACAVKLQTYTPETITLDAFSEDFQIRDQKNPWHGQTLYQLYQKAYTPWEWHKEIFEACKRQGLLAFSSVFDLTAVDFLETLNVPCYKISSFELTHIPLIQKVAKTGKPLILSTGMSSLGEIEEACRVFSTSGGKDLILLKCTSTYPSDPKNSHIKTIPHMEELFQRPIGLSDHTLGSGTSIAAVALGACVIEKHFVLEHGKGAVDDVFSLDPSEMRQLTQGVLQAFESLGEINYGALSSENPFIKHRQSIYITKDVRAGETITKENIRVVRPAFGLKPKYFDIAIGKIFKASAKKGEALSWEHIEA